MARVLITGSSDGLGLMAAKLLIEQGHEVVLHGRNEGRSRDALLAAVGAQGAVTGDLRTIAGATTVASEVNKLGRFNAVIHNAGIGYREAHRVETEPEVPSIFAVNVLAPYIRLRLLRDRKIATRLKRDGARRASGFVAGVADGDNTAHNKPSKARTAVPRHSLNRSPCARHSRARQFGKVWCTSSI